MITEEVGLSSARKERTKKAPDQVREMTDFEVKGIIKRQRHNRQGAENKNRRKRRNQ